MFHALLNDLSITCFKTTNNKTTFSFCDNWNNQGQGIMYLKPLHLFATKSVMALP